MPESAQIVIVRRLYDARGNPDIIRQVLAPDVRWEVVEGFPYGGVYVGLDNVIHNFFGRLFQDYENFVAVGSEFLESGDRVVALGAYRGRAKTTGKDFTA
jgi:ketosteroid isomerase-like protein